MRKHERIFAALLFAMTVVLLATVVAVGRTQVEKEASGSGNAVSKTQQPTRSLVELTEEQLLNPLGMTFLLVEVESERQHPQDEKMIERMTDGLVAYYAAIGGMPRCGEIIEDMDEIRKDSKESASIVVASAKKKTAEESYLCPWGLLGVLAKESKLDPCACGPNVRERAYELGLLKRPKRGPTHDREKLIAALRHPKMKRSFSKSGYDVGIAQMLQAFYDHPDDLERILTTTYGVEQAVKEMRHRANRRRTDRPWAYWPGYHKPSYDAHVTFLARKLGALKDEI